MLVLGSKVYSLDLHSQQSQRAVTNMQMLDECMGLA